MIDPSTTTRWGHPKGLFYLFFAELWERFSFYGMRALLTLYMTEQLLFSDEMAIGIYAAYMSLVYITPTIGGLVAGKLIGYRKAIVLGGVLMAIGHFFLTIETPIFYYGSLALIIVGNGFFKPNISSFVGDLYEENDVRRDAGFTIFYMGINFGAWLAPLLCGWIAAAYGWHFGFMLAGIGMMLGLFFFYRGVNNQVFGDKGMIPDPEVYYKRSMGLTKGNQVTILAILSVPIFALLVRMYQYQSYVIGSVTVLLLGMMGYIYVTSSKIERRRLLVILYFTALATLFWAIFEQAGSSLTLFADRNVNLIGMNAAQTNSIGAGYIILLAIPFALLWSFLDSRRINPNSAVKFAIGLILLGMGFVIFGASANSMDTLAQTPMWYLLMGYFVLTVGEMFMSPIGLSKMTELAPPKYIAFVMGVWFSAVFYGSFFAGKIATLTASDGGENPFSEGILGQIVQFITGLTPDKITGMGDAFTQLYSYVSVYAVFGVITIAIGILALIISPAILRLMGGVK